METEKHLGPVDAVGTPLKVGDFVYIGNSIPVKVTGFTPTMKSIRYVEEKKYSDGAPLILKYTKGAGSVVKIAAPASPLDKDVLIEALTKELEETQMELIKLRGEESKSPNEDLSKQLMELLKE